MYGHLNAGGVHDEEVSPIDNRWLRLDVIPEAGLLKPLVAKCMRTMYLRRAASEALGDACAVMAVASWRHLRVRGQGEAPRHSAHRVLSGVCRCLSQHLERCDGNRLVIPLPQVVGTPAEGTPALDATA
eukprot:1107164-Prymnesium_polylepis.1